MFGGRGELMSMCTKSQVDAFENGVFIQTEAERRRREAGVIQWIENGLRSCLYICMNVCLYVFQGYLIGESS